MAHLSLLSGRRRRGVDRLYYHLVRAINAEIHRIVGPVGLSPHLGRALADSWDAWPPQHTPTNPPAGLERRGG
jgi:hypothetical protein